LDVTFRRRARGEDEGELKEKMRPRGGGTGASGTTGACSHERWFASLEKKKEKICAPPHKPCPVHWYLVVHIDLVGDADAGDLAGPLPELVEPRLEVLVRGLARHLRTTTRK
jgi:hypothetical protein